MMLKRGIRKIVLHEQLVKLIGGIAMIKVGKINWN